MKSPVVFSLVREQSMFMTAIMGLLTFLSILSLGVALAVGTGVVRWNSQWNLMATVQIMNPDNAEAAKKIINTNRDKMETVTEISRNKMTELMRPWISDGAGVMQNYLPQMYEIKFKNASDIKPFSEQISKSARFLTHADALRGATSAGWRMMIMAGLILALALGAIVVCISYIVRNTAQLHRRELEILNQVGARDGFVARQMQLIVGKITIVAAVGGFCVAAPMLLIILSSVKSARVGLMAMMGLSGGAWIILMTTPVLITIFAIILTKRTTLNILRSSK